MTGIAPTADEVRAKAAIGGFMMATADCSLGRMDQEDALEMADAVQRAPNVAAGMLMGRDLTGEDDGTLDGSGVRDRMMDLYYADCFTRLQESLGAERAGDGERRMAVHRDSVQAYSQMDPDAVARAELDAENGDRSLMIQAEERYYLG